MKRTLLDDVEKVYTSIPYGCTTLCRQCENYKPCKIIAKLILSLQKHYKGDDINQKFIKR